MPDDLRKVWEACVDDPKLTFNRNTADQFRRLVVLPDGRHSYTICTRTQLWRRVW